MLTDIFKLPIAHRGLHNQAGGIVENTATAFERAIKGGYAMECDLQLSGDDIAFVFHDDDLMRLTGQQGAIGTLSAGQLERMPIIGAENGNTPLRFSTLLEIVAGKTPLIVELKHQRHERNADLASAAMAAAADYKGPLAFKSFDPELLVLMRQCGFNGPLGIVTERFDSEQAKEHLPAKSRFALRHLLHVTKTKFDFISSNQDALSLPMTQIWRRAGKPVMSWTITSKAEEQTARKRADQIVFEGYLPEIA